MEKEKTSISISDNKLKRKKNFSEFEDEVLLKEIEQRKAKLYGKFSSTISKQVKDREWLQITAAVNKVATVVRSPMELKVRWKNISCKNKKILGEKMNMKSITKTGGGEAAEELTSAEKRVLGILGTTAISGIEGGFDSSTAGKILKKSFFLKFC